MWVKIDDGFHDHPKIRAIVRDSGFAPIGFLLCMMSWSARHLTDGTIPDQVVRELAGHTHRVTPLVTPLVTHGVTRWVSRKRHGVTHRELVVHDWLDYYEAGEVVKARRAAQTERKRRQRERERHADVTRDTLRDTGNVSQRDLYQSFPTPKPPSASRRNPNPKQPEQPGSLPSWTADDQARAEQIRDRLLAERSAKETA